MRRACAAGTARCSRTVSATCSPTRIKRIQSRHGFLKDHPDIPAADAAQLTFTLAAERLAAPAHRSHRTRPRGQQLHDGERRHRFSRSRCADQAENLAGAELERQVLDDVRRADRHAQRVYFQESRIGASPGILALGTLALGLRRLAHGMRSRRRRKPSPSKFKPRTNNTTAMPGKSARDGARAVSVCASLSIRPQLGVGGCAPRPT